MPKLGIIRGYGEAEKATALLIKLIKTLKRRFRSKIEIIELPIGNYELHGSELPSEVIAEMRTCDAVISGDISARSNFIDYDISDIAAALRNDIEFLYIRGTGDHSSVDLRIASYFDGGLACRDWSRTLDGCTETRLCSTYTMMNIVRFICRESEERRRKMLFVKDSENEFCADAFYTNFENFAFPIPNFFIYKTTAASICEEFLLGQEDFDTIIASKTMLEALLGICKYKLGDNFTAYFRFERETSLYYVRSLCNNVYREEAVPSLNSYISALTAVLENKFDMEKEAYCIMLAEAEAAENGFSADNAERYLDEMIKELDKPMKTKFYKSNLKRQYIK